ncbi:hypothetical protein [Aquimarina sp. I32.4]|uniref:hypothetical protein n=1 Tax=Aquimarina sp. I32.4 TaxID=2053903 RepID=UPI000CDEB569|nr:hypothetical protein [Aquimarina sp. I32.4]
MKRRLSFLNEEDLPEYSNTINKKKEKVITISQGNYSSLIVSPIDAPGICYLPYLTKEANLTYGVRIIQEENNSKAQQLDFETKIQTTHTKEGEYCYQINKSDIYINNELPNTTIEELANICGGVLYPIVIGFLDYKIKNPIEIKERWNKLKKEILNKFQGEYVAKYVTATEKIIENVNAMNRALGQDIFLSLLKHIAETRAYDKNLKSEVVFNFPIIPFTNPIRYVGVQTVQKYYTEYNTVKVEYKGEIADNRSIMDLKNKKRFNMQVSKEKTIPQGNCNLQYDLDRKTGMLKFCRSTVTINLDGNNISTTIIINEL